METPELLPSASVGGDVANVTGQRSALMKLLGAEVARSVDTLLMFEGLGLRPAGPEGSKHRAFALVSMVSYSPLFEVFTLCEPVGGSDIHSDEIRFPLTVRLSVSRSSLEMYGWDLGGLETFVHKTSE